MKTLLKTLALTLALTSCTGAQANANKSKLATAGASVVDYINDDENAEFIKRALVIVAEFRAEDLEDSVAAVEMVIEGYEKANEEPPKELLLAAQILKALAGK